jgi:hypothetical protein
MKRIILMAVSMVAIFFQGQAKTENEIKLISYNIRTAWGGGWKQLLGLQEDCNIRSFPE